MLKIIKTQETSMFNILNNKIIHINGLQYLQNILPDCMYRKYVNYDKTNISWR